MPPFVPQPGPSGKPELLDQVRQLLRAHRYSLRTEEAYIGWIRRYILFNSKRHPAELGEEDGRAEWVSLRISANLLDLRAEVHAEYQQMPRKARVEFPGAVYHLLDRMKIVEILRLTPFCFLSR